MTTRAVVFVNGEFHKQQLQRITLIDAESDAESKYDSSDESRDDFIVCVDGGLNHCLGEGLTPNVLIGDLDSLNAHASEALKKLDIPRVQFPPEKDASDLELALQWLENHTVEFESVVVLGASGGRTDHHLFNWQLFASRVWPFKLRVVDDYTDTQFIHANSGIDMVAEQGQVFSVIPLGASAEGVSVTGARYPLHNAKLALGSTVGLSNVVIEPRLQISVISGILLVMMVYNNA